MKKQDVLKSQRDFDALYKKGKSTGSRHVVLLYRKNGLTYSRKAFLASKKVGNSVCRNRARRLMREAFRLNAPDLPSGYDLLFIARGSITESKCADVQKSIAAVLSRSGLTG